MKRYFNHCPMGGLTLHSTANKAEEQAARSLQEHIEFEGTVEARYRQVGNAVPPALAEAVARSVVSALSFPG